MQKSLKQAYDSYFPIGAAVHTGSIVSHSNLLKEHFSSLTAENEMKFQLIHPEKDRYNFSMGDAMVDYATANNMRMRGHTLVWHNQNPEWLFKDVSGNPVSRDELLERMKEHIHTVVGRYKGKIYCWDVCNEVIEDKTDGLLRKSTWFEILGEEFIEKAFEYAHEADPDCILFYNDYYATRPDKLEKITKLLKKLQAKGIPLHGMGMQGHWNIYSPSTDEIRAAIEAYASLGLQVQITEMDVSVYAQDDRRLDITVPEPEWLEKQAVYYREVFKLFREYKAVITGVTFWGISDDTSWLSRLDKTTRKNWPLVFDWERKPKQSLYEILNF